MIRPSRSDYQHLRRLAQRQCTYGSLSIALHWVMLLLLIAVFATIELRGMFPKGSDPREAMKAWHFMLGLAVFGLVWLRLAHAGATAGPVTAIVPASRARLRLIGHDSKACRPSWSCRPCRHCRPFAGRRNAAFAASA